MRIYIPMSLDSLKCLLAEEQVAVSDAFAVTESMCVAHDVDPDDTELAEFFAMSLAAHHILARQADTEHATAIVIAAADLMANPVPNEVTGRVQGTEAASLADIASFHVCDATSVASTVSAPESFDAADLSWWAAQELQQLIHHIENEGDRHG